MKNKEFHVQACLMPGREVYFPTCRISRLFLKFIKSSVPKREAFTVENLKIIREMGYEIIPDKNELGKGKTLGDAGFKRR